MVLNVRLTRSEMSEVKQAAALRWQLARASGVANQRKDIRSDADIDLLGLKAEMAVAKALQLPYRASDLGIDSGADMWSEDVSIDVKATYHKSGKLLFKSLDSFVAEYAILVTISDDEDVMRIVGGMGRDRFKLEAVETDLGRGICWVAPQDILTPIEGVWLALTQWRLCR
tara:strand:- start:890 stop:1402 length:513 start_codon:yes stop_codon:yes gene_type:complete